MASSPVFLSEVPLQDCSCHLAEVGYQFTNICNAGKAADENKNTTNTLAQVDAGASSLQTYSTLCQPQVPSARGSHSLTNAELLLPKQALSATPSGAGEMREPSPSSVRVAVLFGGSTRAAEFKDDLFLYEVASKQWFKPVIKGKVPPARSGHSAVYYKNKLYVFGGQSVTVNPSTGQPTFSFFNDVWVLTLKLGELRWFCFSLKTKPSPSSFLYDRAFPVISPPLTSSHTASLLGSIMYVFGGSNEEGPRNDLYACDLNNMQWYKCNQLSSHPTSKPSPREMHAASTLLCTNGSCAACAGSSAGSHDDQEAAAGDDSNKADAMCYAERFLYVMGGRGKKNVCSDFYQFDVLKQVGG